jgi:uncharacterized protein
MVNIALAEKRIILTRDTHILERRLVRTGRVKAILVRDDNINEQIKQVSNDLDLVSHSRPFTLCLECNRLLETRNKEEIQGRVPPYVWKTQKEYEECPRCHRLYWRGTHWEAMNKKLNQLAQSKSPPLEKGN